jgi:hypothetical protein
LARIRGGTVRGQKQERVVPDPSERNLRIELGAQKLPGRQHDGFRGVNAGVALQAVEFIDAHIVQQPGPLGADGFVHGVVDIVRHPLEIDLPALDERGVRLGVLGRGFRRGQAGLHGEIFVVGDQLHDRLAFVVYLADVHFNVEIRAVAAEHPERLAFGWDRLSGRQRLHQGLQFAVVIRVEAVDHWRRHQILGVLMAQHERVSRVDIGVHAITDQGDGITGAVHEAFAAPFRRRKPLSPRVAFLALATCRAGAFDHLKKVLIVVKRDDVRGADAESFDDTLAVRERHEQDDGNIQREIFQVAEQPSRQRAVFVAGVGGQQQFGIVGGGIQVRGIDDLEIDWLGVVLQQARDFIDLV